MVPNNYDCLKLFFENLLDKNNYRLTLDSQLIT